MDFMIQLLMRCHRMVECEQFHLLAMFRLYSEIQMFLKKQELSGKMNRLHHGMYSLTSAKK